MRIFKNLPEAFEELRRELKEMGTRVENRRVQDKDVGELGNAEYSTLELVNYGYTVLEPSIEDIPVPDNQWFRYEWEERLAGINGRPVNPGVAWTQRKDRDRIEWEDYLENDFQPVQFGEHAEGFRSFSYSYGERFARSFQVRHAINALKRDPLTRQAYISVWDPGIDAERLLDRRVPCSIGYHLMNRGGRLNIFYFMRSCELGTHFYNDVGLALKLMEYVAEEADMTSGSFTHFMGSFHVYAKNVADAF